MLLLCKMAFLLSTRSRNSGSSGNSSSSSSSSHHHNHDQTTSVAPLSNPNGSQNWGHSTTGQTTAVGEASVDAYAKQVLEDASPSEEIADLDYLPSYITGLLRAEHGPEGDVAATMETLVNVRDLPDYDSLLELLQEHCSMARQEAHVCLEKISKAVLTSTVPVEFLYAYPSSTTGAHQTLSSFVNSTSVTNASPVLGPFGSSASSNNGSSALKLLAAVNVEETVATTNHYEAPRSDRNVNGVISSLHDDTTTTMVATPGGESVATSVISPAQANNLIPVDLLGAIDSEDADASGITPAASLPGQRLYCSGNSNQYANYNNSSSSNKIIQDRNDAFGISEQTTASQNSLEEAFPSLSAAAASRMSKRASRSSRSRQSSIDESSVSENSSKKVSPHLEPQIAPHKQLQQKYYYLDESSAVSTDPTAMLQTTFDILVHMNPDMGQDAIFQAATMAGSDPGVAQYLMDCAMTAPPVCRHLLNNGCYRSDCSFSHDLEGHTCVFWLRGRCGKGSACQFLHGYNEKWLQKLGEDQLQHQTELEQYEQEQEHDEEEYSYATYGEGDGGGGGGPLWGGKNANTEVTSFANIASQGYSDQKSFHNQPIFRSRSGSLVDNETGGIVYEECKFATGSVPTIKIPQDVWNPHQNRDSSAFHISDPIQRYLEVSRFHSQSCGGSRQQGNRYGQTNDSGSSSGRTDVIDLHFQSTKTFAEVLEVVLPEKLASEASGVWIVTGTGHHVGTKTHQRGGGVLESAVMNWLTEKGYDFLKGRDRNGHGGALYVKKNAQHYVAVT